MRKTYKELEALAEKNGLCVERTGHPAAAKIKIWEKSNHNKIIECSSVGNAYRQIEAWNKINGK